MYVHFKDLIPKTKNVCVMNSKDLKTWIRVVKFCLIYKEKKTNYTIINFKEIYLKNMTSKIYSYVFDGSIVAEYYISDLISHSVLCNDIHGYIGNTRLYHLLKKVFFFYSSF